jgi:hypothetical protein
VDTSTRQLVELTLNARYAGLDACAVQETKRIPIDSFACALGAFDDPLCGSLREMTGEIIAQRQKRPTQHTLIKGSNRACALSRQ